MAAPPICWAVCPGASVSSPVIESGAPVALCSSFGCAIWKSRASFVLRRLLRRSYCSPTSMMLLDLASSTSVDGAWACLFADPPVGALLLSVNNRGYPKRHVGRVLGARLSRQNVSSPGTVTLCGFGCPELCAAPSPAIKLKASRLAQSVAVIVVRECTRCTYAWIRCSILPPKGAARDNRGSDLPDGGRIRHVSMA